MSEEFCDQCVSYRDIIKNSIIIAYNGDPFGILGAVMSQLDRLDMRGDKTKNKRPERIRDPIGDRIGVSVAILKAMGVIVGSNKEIMDALEILITEVSHELATQELETAEGILK